MHSLSVDMTERLKFHGNFDFEALCDIVVKHGIDDYSPETGKAFIRFDLPDCNVRVQAYATGTLLISFKNWTRTCQIEVVNILSMLLNPIGADPLRLVFQKYIPGPKAIEKKFDALWAALYRRILEDILMKRKLALRELTLGEVDRLVYEEMKREETRPKIGNLFEIQNKLWPQFLQEKHPDIWTLVKDEKPASMPKDILEQFEEYMKKELSAGSWEERSNQKETKKG